MRVLLRLLIMVGLILGVLGAPVAIAFGGCVGMGAPCDGPCLFVSYALPTVAGPIVLQTVEPLQDDTPVSLPPPALKVPTPPPRSPLFCAGFPRLS